MPGKVRLSKKELNALIEQIEADGGDAQEMRDLLPSEPTKSRVRSNDTVGFRLKRRRRTELKSVRENAQRKKILEWAGEQDWVINPSKGMESYVENIMKLGYCPCDSSKTVCPCDESVMEVAEDGYCECRLFWKDLETFASTLTAGESGDEESTS